MKSSRMSIILVIWQKISTLVQQSLGLSSYGCFETSPFLAISRTQPHHQAVANTVHSNLAAPPSALSIALAYRLVTV